MSLASTRVILAKVARPGLLLEFVSRKRSRELINVNFFISPFRLLFQPVSIGGKF